MIPILNELQCESGVVRLVASMADDLAVVNGARASFGKFEFEMTEGNRQLIGFLMRERHGSPFEHSVFRFHIECPLFVAREWQRHRIGSFSELSGRYTKMEPDFYTPSYIRTQVGKPGAYSFEAVEKNLAHFCKGQMDAAYEMAYATYQTLLSRGIAKEVARMVLPLGTLTQFFWTVNARSLMNFISLRNDGNAQYEIKILAEAVESFFSQLMPTTHHHFVNHGRVAP